jgi:hypothetical protein
MSIALPETFVDVSTMRDIPDTQECWVDAGRGVERESVCACMREGAVWQSLCANVRRARVQRDASLHKFSVHHRQRSCAIPPRRCRAIDPPREPA